MTKPEQQKRHKSAAAAKQEEPAAYKKLKTKASSNDSDGGDSPTPKFSSNKLQKLLEPYTKDQLIDLIANFSVTDSALYTRICSTADADVTHRKIFVHGLNWESNRETLVEAFREYGAIEECSAVMDRATGKCKGYGFVLFKSRKGAAKALEQPSKMINNRMTHCQLASTGGLSSAGSSGSNSSRKIFVGNVHVNVDRDRLRDFFAQFGEIEAGPIGFDVNTGKSRGYALFVFKREEDAIRALEQPYKMFLGHQLHCQKASDGKKSKDVVLGNNNPFLAQQQAPALSGAPLNIMWNNPQQQYLGVNPFYGGIFVGGGAPMLAAAGIINPSIVPSAPMGYKASSQGQGSLNGSPSFLGPYGSSLPSLGLPQAFPGSQLQNSSAPRAPVRKWSHLREEGSPDITHLAARVLIASNIS